MIRVISLSNDYCFEVIEDVTIKQGRKPPLITVLYSLEAFKTSMNTKSNMKMVIMIGFTGLFSPFLKNVFHIHKLRRREYCYYFKVFSEKTKSSHKRSHIYRKKGVLKAKNESTNTNFEKLTKLMKRKLVSI